MAKALGIIGNIKGKVGNVVGYNLTDSNNKQTQGLRVYQPNVKNPKTAAQAEQRAKLAPINATYRALKMIIDRGNEGLPYGNKSRLAWLKQAFYASNMPWFTKGSAADSPVVCGLTKGSLIPITFRNSNGTLKIKADDVTDETDITTIGKLSEVLLGAYPSLKSGDQITIVQLETYSHAMQVQINSFIIDTTSSVSQSLLEASAGNIEIDRDGDKVFFSVIVSREGDNGEHLRSTSSLVGYDTIYTQAPYDATSKTAAIESYMASGSANSDWAEESIQ